MACVSQQKRFSLIQTDKRFATGMKQHIAVCSKCVIGFEDLNVVGKVAAIAVANGHPLTKIYNEPCQLMSVPVWTGAVSNVCEAIQLLIAHRCAEAILESETRFYVYVVGTATAERYLALHMAMPEMIQTYQAAKQHISDVHHVIELMRDHCEASNLPLTGPAPKDILHLPRLNSGYYWRV